MYFYFAIIHKSFVLSVLKIHELLFTYFYDINNHLIILIFYKRDLSDQGFISVLNVM